MRSWSFHEGDTIASGRHALGLLGGGRRYEAWLAWDERLRALVVAKLLRPDEAADPAARHTLDAEARMLARLAHPLRVDPGAGVAARAQPLFGPALPGRGAGGAPRREAAQHHHGRLAAADRPERGAPARRARRPARPCGHGRLHG